ncbi:hypothetical protein ACFQFC_20655 [Amorphoplanes digitatis]|uniref:Secreted protein n=1 Tax=Actinoplanes digitatis TaxID=1868 RepID=A0A7W7I546_9ACTN|nr:hypothetical protein [Actinoplanes digitatis]MBB4766629.1 hypothetical protein [Actinoplanes digitatis]GID96130.1 hypothetical protein Adi01nite_55420 [Actinoplanes digitatis]
MPDTLEQAPREPRSERVAFRLAAFGALLVVVLFAGYGIGRLNNSVERAAAAPVPVPAATAGHGHDAAPPAAAGPTPHDDTGAPPHVHNADGTVTDVAGGAPTAEAVGGLAVTASGLTLTPATTAFQAGRRQPFRFRIVAAGAPVTTYAVVHDKALHLVVVRRDLSGFQHLHPAMAPDGTWSIDLTLAAPGSYRAIADFTAIVGGRQTPVTLGVDLTVAGNFTPVALPAPATRATTDGFTISYAGQPQTGVTQPLLMTVTGPGGGAAALEPYLGAFGHLVVFREGDVGYVHVHPEPRLVDGAVRFWLTAPGPGRYRMFFDFQVAGRVHTAAFTTVVR